MPSFTANITSVSQSTALSGGGFLNHLKSPDTYLHLSAASARTYAIHEAGHAVAACLLGFHVEWVSVDREFIRTDPLAIKNGIEGSGAVTMALVSRVLEPISARRNRLMREDKEALHRFGVEVMAGPIAEERLCPDEFEPEACAGDFLQVHSVLAEMDGRKAFQRDSLRRIIASAREFVATHSDLIEIVGAALLDRGTLTGDDVHKLIAQQGERVKVAA